MRITENQIKVMKILHFGNLNGSKIDLDQLLDRLYSDFAWETSKASLQFTIRQLIKNGLIVRAGLEYRRRKLRRILEITPLGVKVLGPSGVVPQQP